MNHIVQPHFTLAYVKTNRLSELYPQIDGDTRRLIPCPRGLSSGMDCATC